MRHVGKVDETDVGPVHICHGFTFLYRLLAVIQKEEGASDKLRPLLFVKPRFQLAETLQELNGTKKTEFVRSTIKLSFHIQTQ